MQVISIDGTRTLRGAAAGALAAAIWAAQQPLDKRLFGSAHDDPEILGSAVTSGRAVYPLGLLMHVSTGAAFGATYANVAPLVPLPPWSKGPVAALAEHLALWPLGRVSDRVHPDHERLVTLGGNRRAFWQETWRHLLFGVVLGELERRLNVPGPPDADDEFVYAATSNGHGSLEHAVSAGPA